MSAKTCPLCTSTLTLKQANLNLAVYICPDINCQYPVGHECIIVERELKNMDKNVDVPKESECHLRDWLDEVITKQPQQSDKTKPAAKDIQEGSNQWIDDLIEEAVSAAQDATPSEEQIGSSTDLDEILDFFSD